MTPIVFGAVIASAAMHASWNSLVKVDLERYLAVTLLALFAALLSLVALPFVPLPPPVIWPWLLVSVLIHCAYVLCLAQSYKTGELGQMYPLARGTAPLIIAIVSMVTGIAQVSPVAFIGIVLLTCGICLLSKRSGHQAAHLERRAVGYAFATSICIAAYTVIDGLGAKQYSPHAFTLWVFFGQGVFLVALLLARRGAGSLPALTKGWKNGLMSGGLSLAAYWLVVWAMTVAPIPLVAALRETSVLFATLISALLLRERLTPARIGASALILIGIAVMRLG